MALAEDGLVDNASAHRMVRFGVTRADRNNYILAPGERWVKRSIDFSGFVVSLGALFQVTRVAPVSAAIPEKAKLPLRREVLRSRVSYPRPNGYESLDLGDVERAEAACLKRQQLIL